MIIIGVDYHPSVQQIAYVDTETGETCERRLNHSDGEAEHFYHALERRQVRVRVGIEATGHARWFERLLAELKFELWIGNAAIVAPKVFESAEALRFAAAWSPIISRTTLIPASLFVMIESSCIAQVTSPPPRLTCQRH